MYTHFVNITFDKHLSALFNFLYCSLFISLYASLCESVCKEKNQHTDTLLTGILPEI